MVGIGIIVCAVVVVSDPTYSHVWLAGSEEWLRVEYCVLDEWAGTFSMGGVGGGDEYRGFYHLQGH